jgi:hypothetical protein
LLTSTIASNAFFGAGETFVQTYDGDFIVYSNGGLVWAAEADYSIRAPLATLSASMYVGAMSFAQFNQQDEGGSITIDALIRNAHFSGSLSDFTLKSSIMNEYLMFD